MPKLRVVTKGWARVKLGSPISSLCLRLLHIIHPFVIRFFASYALGASTWNYAMGNFAQQALPLDDEVILLVQRVNCTDSEIVVVSGLRRSPSMSFLSPFSCPTGPALVLSRLLRTGHLLFKTTVVPFSAPMDKTLTETLHPQPIPGSLLPRWPSSLLSTS